MSLYKRLALSLTLVFAAIIYLLIWWSGELKENTQLESEQRLHLGLASHLVQDNPLLAQGVYDYDALKSLFHTLMMLGPSFEFYYLDPTGKIITYSAEPGKVKRSSVSLEPVKALISRSQDLPILGQDPRQHEHSKIFSAAPVIKDEKLQGYLYMIIRGENYDSIFEAVQADNRFGITSTIVGFSLLFLLVILLGLFRYFTLPLCKISNGIKKLEENKISDKNLMLTLSLPEDEELQLVVSTINELLKQLQGQYQQLQNIDEQRRLLLADLSHDLRTPLSNLQGYIETLYLQGDSLSSADRKKFIDISMKNSQNLKHLIDQIFELAYLEGDQVRLNTESIVIGELIYDIAAKFELAAKEKGITISITPRSLTNKALVDIGKLERVLSNLIDNAIRHTAAGGQVILSVDANDCAPKQLKLSVRDTGVGIAEDELQQIFSARYRASNTKEDSQKHGGLGLAISHKLVDLFESELVVESTLGQGSCFSFTLPTRLP